MRKASLFLLTLCLLMASLPTASAYQVTLGQGEEAVEDADLGFLRRVEDKDFPQPRGWEPVQEEAHEGARLRVARPGGEDGELSRRERSLKLVQGLPA